MKTVITVNRTEYYPYFFSRKYPDKNEESFFSNRTIPKSQKGLPN